MDCLPFAMIQQNAVWGSLSRVSVSPSFAATQSQQSVYRTSDTGLLRRPKPRMGPCRAPFLVGMGPFGRSGGSKFRRGTQIWIPFLVLAPHPSWGEKRSKCEHTKNQKITQRIDQKCMSFDTSCLKTVLSLLEEKKAHRKYAYFSKLWLLIFALCFLPFAERS